MLAETDSSSTGETNASISTNARQVIMCVVKTPSARISSEPTLASVLVVAELARRTAMLATNVDLMLLGNRHALILMSVLIQRSIIVRALRLVLTLSESKCRTFPQIIMNFKVPM